MHGGCACGVYVVCVHVGAGAYMRSCMRICGVMCVGGCMCGCRCGCVGMGVYMCGCVGMWWV